LWVVPKRNCDEADGEISTEDGASQIVQRLNGWVSFCPTSMGQPTIMRNSVSTAGSQVSYGLPVELPSFGIVAESRYSHRKHICFLELTEPPMNWPATGAAGMD